MTSNFINYKQFAIKAFHVELLDLDLLNEQTNKRHILANIGYNQPDPRSLYDYMKDNSLQIRNFRLWVRFLLTALVFSVPITLAVMGAIFVKNATGIDEINMFMETISGKTSSTLGDLALLAPFGFAFAAGVVAAFNPCGFAMLPAYIGLYMGKNVDTKPNILRQLQMSLTIGLTVSSGFVILFGTAGLAIGFGIRSVLSSAMPWLGLFVGIGLALSGAWLLVGGKIYSRLGVYISSSIKNVTQNNVKGYFLFGLSYGAASLSCTLPIFLSVMGSTFSTDTIADTTKQFLTYSLGMGLVITSITVCMALFKETVTVSIKQAIPYIQTIGSWLIIGAGSYIIFYWLTIGGLIT